MKQWLKAAVIGLMITAWITCAVYPVSANTFSADLTSPISFGGEGTKTVNVSCLYPSRTFRLIVDDSATYQIATGTAQRTYVALLNANGTILVKDSAEQYGKNVCITEHLQANTTYYLHTYAHDVMSKGGVAYPLTVQKVEAPVEGELFKREGITVSCGDIIEPAFVTTSSRKITLSSADPAMMYIDENGRAVTAHEGQVQLIATDENGVTDTMTVTIENDRFAMALNNPYAQFRVQAQSYSEDIAVYVFGITVVNHEPASFHVYSQGTCDLAAVLYDENGNVVTKTAGNARGNFKLSASGSKPDTFYLHVRPTRPLESEEVFTVTATMASLQMEAPPLAVYENTYVAAQGDRYTVYRGQEVWINALSDYTAPDSFTDNGSGVLTPTQVGTFSLTSGDTTLQMTVIDYVQGDITLDGTANMRDALKLYQIACGRTTVEETTTALAELTGDNVVNMRDALKIYQNVNGVNNDTDDETPETDPIPGDGTEDEW